jgi:stearoyl-CoA desaturase (delta-9 desaturase)
VRKIAPSKPKLGEVRARIDFDALQAVIHHRYDVMAAYAASLRSACREEAARLRAIRRPEGKLVSAAHRWLAVDASRWTEQQRAKLATVFEASDALRKLIEMRAELQQVWQRSNASREQLVGQLQQWCVRAEGSGVRALRDMSQRLRSYAS